MNQADVSPSPDTGIRNPNLFYAPSSIQFAINGLIYMASNSASYLLNDVLRRRTPPSITSSLVTYSNAAYNTTPVASTWVEIDLAQPHAIGNTGEVALVHGTPVMNSVLSLSGSMPVGNQTYVCVVEFNLNCSWLASRGSAEFVF